MNLYIFITHQGNINNCYNRISKMMSGLDYIIVVGGYSNDFYDESKKILYLNVNDGYVGLPEKVIKTFNYIKNSFNQYTHIIKCDDDMILVKPFNKIDGDYLGKVEYNEGNRNWHIGRTNTHWDLIPYVGDYTPWCLGGFGYIISMNAIKSITPNFEYVDHIYEDLYIAILLKRNNINPININIKEYLKSPDHA